MSPAGWSAALALGAMFTSEPLTFERAVAIALEKTRDVIRAREDVILVDAEHKAAVSAILPRFDLQLGSGEFFAGDPILESRIPPQNGELRPGELPRFQYGPFIDVQAQSYSNPQLSLQLTGQQLLFDGGKWWTAIARVNDVERTRRALLRAVENDLRARVAQRYYTVEKARRAASAMDEQLRVGEGQLDRARALLAAGRGKPSDVAAVVRNVAEDRMTLAQRIYANAQAERALNLEIGLPSGEPVVLALPASLADSSTVATPQLPSLERMIELALDNRPEIDSLEGELAAEAKSVSIARGDYYPVLSLSANYRRQSRRLDRIFANPAENYFATLDLILRWNLFEGRATEARVEVEEVKLRKLVADLEDQQRRVVADVQDSLQNLLLQVENHRLAQQTVTAAAEAVRLARGLFEQGLGTELERRDAELRYTQALLTLASARLDIEVAREALRRALGGQEIGSGGG